MDETIEKLTSIIQRIGRMEGLVPDEDIYQAGFSSISALELLTEMEVVFEVSIADDEFIESRSIRQLAAMISRLREGAPA